MTVQVRTGGRSRQVEVNCSEGLVASVVQGFRIRFLATEDATQVPESVAQDQSSKAFAACVPQGGAVRVFLFQLRCAPVVARSDLGWYLPTVVRCLAVL